MQNNQDIMSRGITSVKAKAKLIQFEEQKVLISIIEEKRNEANAKAKAKGTKETKTKYFTINNDFKETTLKEFNKRMASVVEGYTSKTPTQFKHLLYSIYVIKNRHASSRTDELGELITTIEQVPFE